MEIIGKVIECGGIKKGTSAKSGKEWQSFEFVIESEGQYPKKALLKVFGEEKIKEFGALCNPKLGKAVKVSFDIDANEYNGRWYNSLMVWKIEEAGAENAPEPNQPSKASVTDFAPPAKDKGSDKPVQAEGNSTGGDGDLPF